MCLYPKLIRNRRYLPNKKNGGVPPVCPDERLLYVTAACGKCMECRKQKQRQWVVRMSEELRQNPNAYFMTLTIDDENYTNLANICSTKIGLLSKLDIFFAKSKMLFTLNPSTFSNGYRDWETDRKSTRLNSSHSAKSRMPSSA